MAAEATINLMLSQPVQQGQMIRIEDHFARFLTVRAGNFRLSDGEIADAGGALVAHPCRRTMS